LVVVSVVFVVVVFSLFVIREREREREKCIMGEIENQELSSSQGP
jgi:hypothetical protein